MADYQSLKGVIADCKSTLTGAAKTIRSLIQQRNEALAAAQPADITAAQEERKVVVEAADLQAGLEQARADAQAAIGEAEATPVITHKPTPEPAKPEYPKTLGDGTNAGRDAVVVNNAKEENAARFKGFSVVVP